MTRVAPIKRLDLRQPLRQERKLAEVTHGLKDPVQEPGWDEWIMSHPDYTFFHGAAWARVMEKAYGFLPHYLTLEEGSKLRALLPLMEVSSWAGGRRGVSLPFTDECVPLTSERSDGQRLLTAALERGHTRQWKYWECRGGCDLFDHASTSVSFFGHTMELQGTEETLFESFDSPVRRALRKAERAGVKGEISASIEALRAYYRLHCQTRRRLGTPPQPWSFFEAIHRHVLAEGDGCVALARWQGRAIAGAVYFHLGTKAVYKFAASDDRFQEWRGGNVVVWSAIQWLLRRGITELNFGRTSADNDGLRRFKKGWGAREYEIACARYDFRTQKFVKDVDRATGWQNQVFRRMPIAVLRGVGALLYKQMA